MNSSFEKKKVIHFVNLETNPRLWYSNAYSQPIRSVLFCQYAFVETIVSFTNIHLQTNFHPIWRPYFTHLELMNLTPQNLSIIRFQGFFFVEKYHSTLAASTLIILFSEMSKFSPKKFPNSKILWRKVF
jgi:hypothetical protein